MKKNIAVSLAIGYLATYYPVFTEELSVIERTTGTIGLGICFLMFIETISQVERMVHKLWDQQKKLQRQQQKQSFREL